MGNRALVLVFLAAIQSLTFAASCCGGGAGSSSIVTSDDRAKVYFNYKNTAYVYDVDTSGEVTKRTINESEVLETFRVGGAYLFDNYIQLALSSTISKVTKDNSLINESSTSLSDTNVSVGYEFLKEKYFSYWKPRGFVYFAQTIPTGRSKYESNKPLQTDVTGGGFNRSTVGLTFFKLLKEFDLTLNTSLSYYMKRKFSDVEVYRYPTSEIAIAGGYSPKMGMWRFGSAISFKYDGHSELQFNDGIKTNSKNLFLTNLDFSVNYMPDSISYTLIYTDQTLLNSNRNTSLERALSLNLSKSFPL